MSGAAARNGGPVGIAALLIVLALGLGLRVSEAWQGRPPVYDAEAYARIAKNLEHNEGFTLGPEATQPASNYSPGIPLIAASLYDLSGGTHEPFARVVLAILGSLAILFAYLIGRRIQGPFAGLVAAAATAAYPALIEYQGMLMGEPLATTLLAGAVLAMLWAARVDRSGLPRPPLSLRRDVTAAWLLPGALIGLLALIRPEYVGVAFLLAVVVLARGFAYEWRESLIHAVIFLAGAAVVVAPWTVRNAVALDRLVPVSTGGGQVLFAGSYLPSGGDPEAVGREVLERHPGLTRRLTEDLVDQGEARSRFLSDGATNDQRVVVVLAKRRLEQVLAALAAQRYPELEADRALARMGRERLGEAISDEPLAYLGFLAAKLWRLWGHGPRQVMHEPGWALLQWALLALALAGLVLLAGRRRWEALLLGILLLSVTAVGLLLVASPRRALVAIPLLAALAGVGATACRDSLARWLL
jgi:hypothetical protein